MRVDSDKINYIWTWVLFFIWPLVAVVHGCRSLGSKGARFVIIGFFGLFGLNLVFSEATDSFRHAESFREVASKPFSEFLNLLSGLYSTQVQKPDILMDFVEFIVSRFTANTHIYFMILGLLLGWILMKNVKFCHDLYMQRPNVIGLLFLIFIFALLPPMRIVSFRHYFALGVFVFSVYMYFKKEKPIFLLFIISTVLIHYGYLMAVPLFFIYKFAGNRNKAYYFVIALSFIFAEQASTFIRTYGSGLEAGVESAVHGYTGEKYLARIADLQQNRNFLINNFMRWTTLFMLLALLFHKFRYGKFDAVSERLYSFCLVFFAFVNFTAGLESISGRFSVVFQVLCCVFFIHLYASNSLKANSMFKFTTIVALGLNILIMGRITLEYMNFVTIVPFLPFSLFTDSDISILKFIK